MLSIRYAWTEVFQLKLRLHLKSRKRTAGWRFVKVKRNCVALRFSIKYLSFELTRSLWFIWMSRKWTHLISPVTWSSLKRGYPNRITCHKTSVSSTHITYILEKSKRGDWFLGEVLLNRFLHICNYSIEQTKNLMDLFYTLRSQAPEIFSDRDPASPELLEIFENL